MSEQPKASHCDLCDLTWEGPWIDCPGCLAQAGMKAISDLKAAAMTDQPKVAAPHDRASDSERAAVGASAAGEADSGGREVYTVACNNCHALTVDGVEIRPHTADCGEPRPFVASPRSLPPLPESQKRQPMKSGEPKVTAESPRLDLISQLEEMAAIFKSEAPSWVPIIDDAIGALQEHACSVVPDWVTCRSLGIGMEIPPDGEYALIPAASSGVSAARLSELKQQVETLWRENVGYISANQALTAFLQQLREQIEQLPQCWSLPSSSHLQDKCVRLSDVLKILNSQQEK